MSQRALLVINVQCAFHDDEAVPPVFDSERILTRISGVVQRARASGVPLVYLQHGGGLANPLEVGSQGWQIHPVVRPVEGDVIVSKVTADAFHETSLKEDLDALNVKSLFVVGNMTELCIDTTCRRAFSLGYKTTLIKDAHSTWNNEHFTAPEIIAHHNLILGQLFVDLEVSNKVDFAQASLPKKPSLKAQPPRLQRHAVGV